MTVTVTPVDERDLDDLVDLILDIEAHYDTGPPPPRDALTAQTRRAVLDAVPAARVLLARDADGRILGMAAYTLLWPAAFSDTSAYLKELYVRPAHRRRGVGRLLFDHVRAAAAAAGCHRMEWTTDTDNLDARTFYHHLAAAPIAKTFYRLGTELT